MNKADKKLGFCRSVKNDKPCVFISYKQEDQEIAIELGKFIENQFRYDIYLDIFDCKLQEALSVENDEQIVSSIKDGLSLSNILLCIISDETKLSWWVPYEIGIADNMEKAIASIKTKDIRDIPSFIKTKESLKNINDLVSFLLKYSRYGGLFFEKKKIMEGDKGNLEKYFD